MIALLSALGLAKASRTAQMYSSGEYEKRSCKDQRDEPSHMRARTLVDRVLLGSRLYNKTTARKVMYTQASGDACEDHHRNHDTYARTHLSSASTCTYTYAQSHACARARTHTHPWRRITHARMHKQKYTHLSIASFLDLSSANVSMMTPKMIFIRIVDTRMKKRSV